MQVEAIQARTQEALAGCQYRAPPPAFIIRWPLSPTTCYWSNVWQLWRLVCGPRKTNRDTDGRNTKYFHVITPSTEISSPGSGNTGSTTNPTGTNNAGHVSDIDTESSDPNKPGKGDVSADAGPSEMEQRPRPPPVYSLTVAALMIWVWYWDYDWQWGFQSYFRPYPWSWSEVHAVDRTLQA